MFEIILFGLVCLCGFVMFICKFAFPNIAYREPEPWYLDYARSFFPVLLLVFLLRGLVAEPFRIPSGSMLPTLEVGDFILVNKFSYGLRLPILHKKVVATGEPKRGDIVVFRYPPNPSQNYIKRLIGLPGDSIEYRNRTLRVNGAIVPLSIEGDYLEFGHSSPFHQSYTQVVDTEDGAGQERVQFSTLLNKRPKRELVGSWVVPEGHYFMMGDNRENSADSRDWGFVPDKNIVGKAFFIWMHYNPLPGGSVDFSRIGTDIEAAKVNAELGTAAGVN